MESPMLLSRICILERKFYNTRAKEGRIMQKIKVKNMGKEPDADDLRAMEELLEELREKIACINVQIKEV